MFKQAIVRLPCPEMTEGITSANLGPPDYEKALEQHARYIEALRTCGLEVTVLDADYRYPDSTFVEDTALLTPRGAVVTNPGALPRRGEVREMSQVLAYYFDRIEEVEDPGTVDAGDIMMVGSHYFIGLSGRTNLDGAKQVIRILNSYGCTGSTVPLPEGLHLKSGVAYLENNNLLATRAFVSCPEFKEFDVVPVDTDESYAANCVWVNGTVLVAAGYPKTKAKIEALGYPTIVLDTSEFRKLDGGLSCLSLRF